MSYLEHWLQDKIPVCKFFHIFSLVFAFMGRLQGKVFLIQFLFLIHFHHLIQKFCGISLSLSCNVYIDIHGSAYVRVS